MPNAFCLPNGRIAVYTGILPITRNIDGLAAVVGHEVAHATRRHGGIRMTQAAISSVALAVAEVGLELSEIDRESRAYTMAALGGSGPEFLSSHPDPLKRAARLRAAIPAILREEAAAIRAPIH